jgi:hypothetical protein
MAVIHKLKTLDDVSDLASADARKKVAKALMRLFDQWDLDNATRLNLLGLSENSRALLTQYRRGEKALSASRDALDRAGWLLAIHKALRLLYPQNDQLRHSWVNRRNRALGNYRPLEMMTEKGIIGLANISRYLDFQRGR